MAHDIVHFLIVPLPMVGVAFKLVVASMSQLVTTNATTLQYLMAEQSCLMGVEWGLHLVYLGHQ
jgi:hypothetical protein